MNVALDVNGSALVKYSPITLSPEWPKLQKLLFLLFCATVGSILNGFFVSSFFIEHTLKKVGNVFLACNGLADLIVTTCVIPVGIVVLLSGEWDNIPVCLGLHFLTEISTYCYSIFFSLVAAETYYKLCKSPREYEMFVSMRVGLVSIIVFTVSVTSAACGVFLELDYDYCERKHYGNYYYRLFTSLAFHGIPFVLIVGSLIICYVRVRRRARNNPQYNRSQQYGRDSLTARLNLTAYMVYSIAWSPYVIIAVGFPDSEDPTFYHCIWIGVFRAVISGGLYGSANRDFRRAFAHLFNYCCCKSSLSSSFTSRHRRALEYKPASGDVRVHIMHKAVNAGSPQRAASSSRDTQEL
ncbi:melatonin receptor type 1A-A-like [Pectinophora gossypiella]|uniref:melatonin receptor type 1A-A-like n=1 Tax=Pectinophora gossypiella TaxID=13191 RepID=UPI00214E1FCA|nr:melatonin receptor type 1A-A-like [Pectinophora gossypiella]XP_049885338.1 melatonin receptor type 1A-A-like [Pectinophora gossypiella]